MKYKGYTAVVEFDEGSAVLFGHVIGLRDAIAFQGDSVAEVIQAFHDSVDDYLEFCAERGESPEKPYSGQFVLRIDPELHRTMSHAAEERRVSLNSLIEEELTIAFSPERARRAAPVLGLGEAASKRAEGTVLPPGSGSRIAGQQHAPKGAPSRRTRDPKRSKGTASGKGVKS